MYKYIELSVMHRMSAVGIGGGRGNSHFKFIHKTVNHMELRKSNKFTSRQNLLIQFTALH